MRHKAESMWHLVRIGLTSLSYMFQAYRPWHNVEGSWGYLCRCISIEFFVTITAIVEVSSSQFCDTSSHTEGNPNKNLFITLWLTNMRKSVLTKDYAFLLRFFPCINTHALNVISSFKSTHAQIFIESRAGTRWWHELINLFCGWWLNAMRRRQMVVKLSAVRWGKERKI